MMGSAQSTGGGAVMAVDAPCHPGARPPRRLPLRRFAMLVAGTCAIRSSTVVAHIRVRIASKGRSVHTFFPAEAPLVVRCSGRPTMGGTESGRTGREWQCSTGSWDLSGAVTLYQTHGHQSAAWGRGRGDCQGRERGHTHLHPLGRHFPSAF